MSPGRQLLLFAYSHTRLLFPESLRVLLTQDPNFLLEDSWGHLFLSVPPRAQDLVMVEPRDSMAWFASSGCLC